MYKLLFVALLVATPVMAITLEERVALKEESKFNIAYAVQETKVVTLCVIAGSVATAWLSAANKNKYQEWTQIQNSLCNIFHSSPNVSIGDVKANVITQTTKEKVYEDQYNRDTSQENLERCRSDSKYRNSVSFLCNWLENNIRRNIPRKE